MVYETAITNKKYIRFLYLVSHTEAKEVIIHKDS